MAEIENARDVRMIEQLVRSAVWQIPDAVLSEIPAEMYRIVTSVHPALQADGTPNPKAGQHIYSTRARTSASRTLKELVGQNLQQTPGPEQKHEVRFTGDLHAAKLALAGLSKEQLEKLAAASEVLERIAQAQPQTEEP